jgi:hypothetical protein
VQDPRISLKKRSFAFLLPLSFLMLSMAVFGWGLQYKLSLYKAKNSITHSVPEAKVALAGAAHGFAAGKRVPYRTAFLTKDLLGSGRSIGAWLVPGRSPLPPNRKHREGASSLPSLPRIAILPPSSRLVVGLIPKKQQENSLDRPWPVSGCFLQTRAPFNRIQA